MQVERRVSNTSFFEDPEPFDLEKMESYLEDSDVEEVHVFKASPLNKKMAELRTKYPEKTRRQLRKMLKNKKHLTILKLTEEI